MQDDFKTLWHNNDRARELFDDLAARMAHGTYNDEYLMQLAAYREAGGSTVHADIFAAQYLLACGDAESAAVCAERARARRPLHGTAIHVLSRAYTALGRYEDALIMQAYESNLSQVPISPDVPTETISAETLDRLAVVLTKPGFPPFAVRMEHNPKTGALTNTGGVFAGEFIPAMDHVEPCYYVGVYTEQGMQGDKAWQLSLLRDQPGVIYFGAGDFVFDVIRAQRAPGQAHIDIAPGEEIVLPILGTVLPAFNVQEPQRIRIRTAAEDNAVWLNTATPNFFRLNKTTDFSSAQDFLVGTPIHIGHAPRRRRLVLNILADALPWAIIRDCFAEQMPNTHRFFQEGIIFDQHFSAAEYTYPSFSSIETGMYPHRSGLFNNKQLVSLPLSYVPLSARMKEMGYATANLMGLGDGIYNGASRGYDRLIVEPYRQLAYEGVERLIRLLDGMGDADHFILLHVGDAHPWPAPFFQMMPAAQARVPLAVRLTELLNAPPSPYLPPTPINQAAFWQGVRDLDRALGTLFTYLEQNYDPEDYFVNLYSDHGVSIFSPQPHIVEEALTRATRMMRGTSVPQGVVTDELTSAVDIYPTLGHLCGFPVGENVDGVLPKIFGGPGRDIAFSNSLFPSRSYFLAARSRTHSLCLETEGIVAPDGTVDLARAKTAIYPRTYENEPGYEVDSEELRAFFYPQVREFLRGIENNGEVFPPLTDV